MAPTSVREVLESVDACRSVDRTHETTQSWSVGALEILVLEFWFWYKAVGIN